MDYSNIYEIIELIRKIILVFFTQITIFKILNDKKYFSIPKIFGYIILILLEPFFELLKYKTNFFNSTIFLVFSISCVTAIITRKKLGYNIFLTLVSLALNYICYFIALIIWFFINKITIQNQNDILNLIIILGIYMMILIAIIENKRLKYGIVSLQDNLNNEYIDILILSISIEILTIGVIFYNKDNFINNNLIIIFVITLVLMFITIQKSLQLYYKQKMLIKDLTETKEELEIKKKEILELEKENIRISKKNHTIVHKQKSIEHKLEEMIMKTEISSEESAEVKERLDKLHTQIYSEKENTNLDKTNISNIDDMLKYMQSECIKNKIEFILVLKGNIHYMVNNFISKEDLETLLADHIKDAIIAINHTDNINRSILVKLGNIDGIYSLYIYDSGVEFNKEVLENLGNKPFTTYKDEGGTGMGFMNTFDTLRKCKASLTIEEFNEPKSDNYTKLLAIKFDNKNEFEIKSYRSSTIKKNI